MTDIESPGPNARFYWEMYGGLPIDNPHMNAHVVGLDATILIGGHRAKAGYLYYQLSVYARATLEGDNLAVLYRRIVDTEPGEMWRAVRVNVPRSGVDMPITTRCIVVKLESTAPTHATPAADVSTKIYADQVGKADPPPWGIHMVKAKVWGCENVMRNTRPSSIMGDIVGGRGFDVDMPADTFLLNQFSLTDIPNDRWQSLDALNAVLGYDYFCWDGHLIEFAPPGSGTERVLAADDPSTSWSYEQNINEVFNAVRVQWNDKTTRPRETVVTADSAVLGDLDRADVVQAPESCKSEKEARKIAKWYLRDHTPMGTEGSVTVVGNQGHDDALLLRPGDMIRMTGPRSIAGRQKATRVTLHLTEWSAEVQFGVNSKRFDVWLARLAAGAKTIKRR